MADKTLSDVVNKLQDIENKINNVPTKGDSKSASKLAAAGNALNLKALGDKIKAPFTNLKDSITGGISGLKGAITAPFVSLKDTLSKPFAAIKKGFGGIGNFFKNRKEQKTLAGLEEVMEKLIEEFIGANEAHSEDFNQMKMYLNSLDESLVDITDAIYKIADMPLPQSTQKIDTLDVDGVPESIGDDVSDIIKDGLPVKVVSLPETEDGNSLADQEDKKESRKLLVRIAKALESGGGGGEGPDIKASGKLGMLGKMGRGLGEGIGGLLKGIGGGFKYLGKNFGKIIKGALAIAAIGVALIPAAIAFQEFGEVTWSAVAVGLTVLAGLTIAAAALSLASPAILIGAAAIAVLALAMLPAAKAFEMFAAAINEHVMPALRQFQPIVTAFIDGLVENFGSMAEIVEGFIAGTVDTLTTAFERGAAAIGGLIQTIANEVKEIAKLDGEALQATAKGILAVGGALAAFGAGGSVGSILGSIGDGFAKLFGAESPIDKLKIIAGLGPDLERGLRPLEKLPETLETTLQALKEGLLDDLVDVADDINGALGRIAQARIFGFGFRGSRSAMRDELELAADAAKNYFEEIEDGLDNLDMSKLEKLTGLSIQMGTIDNAAAQSAAAQAAPTIINNYYDNSSISSTNVNQTTLNETNIADDGAGTVSPAFS